MKLKYILLFVGIIIGFLILIIIIILINNLLTGNFKYSENYKGFLIFSNTENFKNINNAIDYYSLYKNYNKYTKKISFIIYDSRNKCDGYLRFTSFLEKINFLYFIYITECDTYSDKIQVIGYTINKRDWLTFVFYHELGHLYYKINNNLLNNNYLDELNANNFVHQLTNLGTKDDFFNEFRGEINIDIVI